MLMPSPCTMEATVLVAAVIVGMITVGRVGRDSCSTDIGLACKP